MKKAFTLVELMVVMAIIAFLSVGAYAGITFALQQGRNTQRMRIADQLQTALTQYYADFQNYPKCTSPSPLTGNIVSCPGAIVTGTGLGTLLTTDSSAGGLKDYFDGDFNLGSAKTPNSVMYYYEKATSTGNVPIKFTVCVDLESKRGGNTTKAGTATVVGNTDCYCVGANQSTVACQGVTDVP